MDIKNIDIKELAKIAKKAGARATKDSRDKGLPITELKEGRVVKTYPDGRQEVLV